MGHCHPRVAKVGGRQLTLLNTNTRYVSEQALQLADRLKHTLPSRLSVCYFVCSGSEANELALRMAAAHTKRKGVLVIDGNTCAASLLVGFLFFAYLLVLDTITSHKSVIFASEPTFLSCCWIAQIPDVLNCSGVSWKHVYLD